MRSLILVSVPKSLSTLTVDFIQEALSLKRPQWTTAGEVLNTDRMTHSSGIGASGQRFLTADEDSDTPEDEPEQTFGDQHDRQFERLLQYLDHVVQAENFLYKDVIQPFVSAEYIRASEINSIYLHRPLTDVAYFMIQNDWYFPGNAVEGSAYPEENLILGLHRAQKTLRTAAEAT
ncbi:MAG: hypothetical protein ABEK50_11950, partial [bacterium]